MRNSKDSWASEGPAGLSPGRSEIFTEAWFTPFSMTTLETNVMFPHHFDILNLLSVGKNRMPRCIIF